MNQFKFLILMSYFNRPILVRNALESILKANQYYKNWHLVFGDDGSKIAGKKIVEEVLCDYLNQIDIVEIESSCEDKINNGIQIGRYANEAMLNSSADIVVTLGDDDEFVPDYLYKLNEFYNKSDVIYSFCKIHLYNPLFHKSKDINNVAGKYNSWETPINPSGKLDASQVTWRLSAVKEHGVRYFDTTKVDETKPWIHNTDKSIFDLLFEKFGECVPNHIIGQYKGIHDYQLLWNKNRTAQELREYYDVCEKNAGILF